MNWITQSYLVESPDILIQIRLYWAAFKIFNLLLRWLLGVGYFWQEPELHTREIREVPGSSTTHQKVALSRSQPCCHTAMLHHQTQSVQGSGRGISTAWLLPFLCNPTGWPPLRQVHRYSNNLSFSQQVHTVLQLFLGCKACVCPLILFVSQKCLQLSPPSACFFNDLLCHHPICDWAGAAAVCPGAIAFPSCAWGEGEKPRGPRSAKGSCTTGESLPWGNSPEIPLFAWALKAQATVASP